MLVGNKIQQQCLWDTDDSVNEPEVVISTVNWSSVVPGLELKGWHWKTTFQASFTCFHPEKMVASDTGFHGDVLWCLQGNWSPREFYDGSIKAKTVPLIDPLESICLRGVIRHHLGCCGQGNDTGSPWTVSLLCLWLQKLLGISGWVIGIWHQDMDASFRGWLKGRSTLDD